MTNLQCDAVSKLDMRRKHTVDATGGDGDDPRGNVGHGGGNRAGIPGTADYHDILLHSMQRSNGYAVSDIGNAGSPPNGKANDSNAVGDGVIHGRKQVVVEARVPFRRGLGRNRPARFVDGQAHKGGAPAGRATAYAADRGRVGNPPSAHDRRRVSPVPVDVPCWFEVRFWVERAVISLIPLYIEASPYYFPVIYIYPFKFLDSNPQTKHMYMLY